MRSLACPRLCVTGAGWDLSSPNGLGEQAESSERLVVIPALRCTGPGQIEEVGADDYPGTRYGVLMQGATSVALTKIDCLSYMNEIPICEAYDINGTRVDAFPFTPLMDGAKPIMTSMPGWGTDITGIRRYDDLPKEARDYRESFEIILIAIKYVSVGPERDNLMFR